MKRRKLLADGADGLISFGIAGGLARGLRPGTLVVGDGGDNRRWPALSRDGPDRSGMERIRAPVFGGRVIVSRAEDKQELYDTTGAVAVDLESAEVARLCAAAGVPFAVIRAIGDPAERDLPPAALVGLKADGQVDLRRFCEAATVARSDPGASDGCAGYPSRVASLGQAFDFSANVLRSGAGLRSKRGEGRPTLVGTIYAGPTQASCGRDRGAKAAASGRWRSI